MMRFRMGMAFTLLFSSLSFLLLQGQSCEVPASGGFCKTNGPETRRCICPDGTDSVQKCQADGYYSPCQCDGDVRGADADGPDAGDAGGAGDTEMQGGSESPLDPWARRVGDGKTQTLQDLTALPDGSVVAVGSFEGSLLEAKAEESPRGFVLRFGPRGQVLGSLFVDFDGRETRLEGVEPVVTSGEDGSVELGLVVSGVTKGQISKKGWEPGAERGFVAAVSTGAKAEELTLQWVDAPHLHQRAVVEGKSARLTSYQITDLSHHPTAGASSEPPRAYALTGRGVFAADEGNEQTEAPFLVRFGLNKVGASAFEPMAAEGALPADLQPIRALVDGAGGYVVGLHGSQKRAVHLVRIDKDGRKSSTAQLDTALPAPGSESEGAASFIRQVADHAPVDVASVRDKTGQVTRLVVWGATGAAIDGGPHNGGLDGLLASFAPDLARTSLRVFGTGDHDIVTGLSGRPRAELDQRVGWLSVTGVSRGALGAGRPPEGQFDAFEADVRFGEGGKLGAPARIRGAREGGLTQLGDLNGDNHFEPEGDVALGDLNGANHLGDLNGDNHLEGLDGANHLGDLNGDNHLDIDGLEVSGGRLIDEGDRDIVIAAEPVDVFDFSTWFSGADNQQQPTVSSNGHTLEFGVEESRLIEQPVRDALHGVLVSGTVEVADAELDQKEFKSGTIGLVLGFSSSETPNRRDAFALSWRRAAENPGRSGLALSRVKAVGPGPKNGDVGPGPKNGDVGPGPKNGYIPETEVDGQILAQTFGRDKGWEVGREYRLDIVYSRRQMAVALDGEVVLAVEPPAGLQSTIERSAGIGFFTQTGVGARFSRWLAKHHDLGPLKPGTKLY